MQAPHRLHRVGLCCPLLWPGRWHNISLARFLEFQKELLRMAPDLQSSNFAYVLCF